MSGKELLPAIAVIRVYGDDGRISLREDGKISIRPFSQKGTIGEEKEAELFVQALANMLQISHNCSEPFQMQTRINISWSSK